MDNGDQEQEVMVQVVDQVPQVVEPKSPDKTLRSCSQDQEILKGSFFDVMPHEAPGFNPQFDSSYKNKEGHCGQDLQQDSQQNDLSFATIMKTHCQLQTKNNRHLSETNFSDQVKMGIANHKREQSDKLQFQNRFSANGAQQNLKKENYFMEQ